MKAVDTSILTDHTRHYPPRKTRRRPELEGFARMTPAEQKAAKAAVWQAYYAENKARLQEKSRERARRTKGAIPTRPAPRHCEACGGPPSGKYGVFHADHDHATGDFRGWLCMACNIALGNALEDPARLRGLADYIEQASLLRNT
jgi:hypothetical protein